MNYLLISVLCLVLMACNEHKQNSPKASSQQKIGLSESAIDLPKTQLIHGWPKEQIQALQQKAAKAVGVINGISFTDYFKIDGVIYSAPKLIIIPPGQFVMGCYDWEAKSCFPRESRKSLITIDYVFAVSENKVNNADYALCVKAKYCEPNDSITVDDEAVAFISWSEAQAYTRWLSDATGEKYRLLSSSEHEYASRAGGTGQLLGNNTDCSHIEYQNSESSNDCFFNPKERYSYQSISNSNSNSKPNAFGLLNMHRGRWEWLQDCWHNSILDNTPKDGSAYTEESGCKSDIYLARGGDMGGIKTISRASNRHIGRKNDQYIDVGFRVAREID